MIPGVRSPFLQDVLASLAKRRKAIRYKARGIKIERVIERKDGEEWEKIEISCPMGPRRDLRLFIWSDRWLWVDARESRKHEGWVWQFTSDGRLAGGLGPRELVAALEASIFAAQADMGAEEELREVWRHLLASGPRPVG